MRIINRAHVPWFIFVCLATAAAGLLYAGNFHGDSLPRALRLPPSLLQTPSEHRSVGGTPIGLIFGAISLGIFVFAALLGVRKKIVLWRIGTVQRWLRAHIWLTLLTIPLVILHSGFRLGGPMTTLLMVLYAVVMISGIYGLTLQHHLPHLMKERLPAETVFEQIPHILSQLVAAAEKMRDSFKPAPPKQAAASKVDAGAPAPSDKKTATAGAAAMASTAPAAAAPSARAKTAVGSTITAEPVTAPAGPADSAEGKNALKPPVPDPAAPTPSKVAPEEARGPQAAAANAVKVPNDKGPETIGTPTARVPEGVKPVPSGTEAAPANVIPPATEPTGSVPAAVDPKSDATPAGAAKPTTATPAPAVAKSASPAPKPAPAKAPAPKPAAAPAPAPDPLSEAFLVDFLDRQIIPYLKARRGDKMRLGKARYAEDTFRFVQLRVAEAYRTRVEEVQAWCDERRMLDLQTRMQHWLHAWLFLHVPSSFLLLMLTGWHAFVTLFYY